MIRIAISLCAGLWAATVWAAALAVEVMLPLTDIDAEGDRNVFATPFDYRDGQLFTVHVAPAGTGGPAGINLRTIVRKGVRRSDGGWAWESRVIEERTLLDPWHTQASIALDREGFVHVACNMHNMPWQYSVSRRPMDISEFEFRGQAIDDDARNAVKVHNRTPFPDAGTAAIPGNQVTYPMFFTDRIGDLYVTYRFALRPAQTWEKRAFAGAIAKYDVATRQWRPIGGALPVSAIDARPVAGTEQALYRPFAFEDGYSVYLITLAFDENNGMHVFWHWRPGGAGIDTTRPSYAYSPDGVRFYRSSARAYALPIGYDEAERVGRIAHDVRYYAPKSVAVAPPGEPLVVLQPLVGGRQIMRYDKASARWADPEPSPGGAPEIVTDGSGRLWAFASGLRVFMRSSASGAWQEVGHIGAGLCAPRVKYVADESRFVIHAKSCDGRQATIVSFRR